MAYDFLRFAHILSVVFMAWPLYALISVNERGRLGAPLGSDADAYMENIIIGQTTRCFVFQATALVTGILLVVLTGMGLSSLFSDGILAAKVLILLGVAGLLSYVRLAVQPKIDRLFARAKEAGEGMPKEIASQIGPLRMKRKKLASLCLFLVISLVIFGVQVQGAFSPLLTIALLILAAVFSRRAFKGPLKYGWM